MNIIEMASNNVSLEFGPSELDAVLSGLRGYGQLRREARTTYELLTVDGEQFIFENEWDEPCLISKSARGDAMLRELAAAARSDSSRRRAAG